MAWDRLFKTVDAKPYKNEIDGIVDEIFGSSLSVSVDTMLKKLRVHSDGLPKEIRESIYEFKLQETSAVLKISLDISNYEVGQTPSDIQPAGSKNLASKLECLQMLLSGYLGEIFTWSSIQHAHMVNDIIPIKEHINRPISSGADIFFDLHTEDGFHPFMGDYLSLFCLRNPNNISTVLSCLDLEEIDMEQKRILFEPRFFVGANIAHSVKQDISYLPLLFGDWNNPYLRINLNNISVRNNDEEAARALQYITDKLRLNMVFHPLAQGEILFIDNFRVVHGRETYQAAYDGTDRWLKRLYVTNDLRKSRHCRYRPESRIINVS